MHQLRTEKFKDARETLGNSINEEDDSNIEIKDDLSRHC